MPPFNFHRYRQGADSARLSLVQSYRELIEKELQGICRDVLNVLDTHLLPNAASHESRVFYHKM